MKDKRLIIHSIAEPFPQPDTAEIEQEPTHWVGFNDFFWKLYLMAIHALNQPKLWVDHSEELDSALSKLMIDQEPPMIFSGAQVLKTAGQNFSNGGLAGINFNTESWDTDGYWSSANPDRFTAPFDGYFRIDMSIHFNAAASGVREARLYKDADLKALSRMDGNMPNGVTIHVGRRFYLLTGEYVELKAIQSTGGPLTLFGGSYGSWAEIRFDGE